MAGLQMQLWVLVSPETPVLLEVRRDWLQVLLEPWLLSAASRRVRCQSRLHACAHAMSSQQRIKGLMKTLRAWTPVWSSAMGELSRGCAAQPDLILLPMLPWEGRQCNAEPVAGLPAWPEHSDLKTSFFSLRNSQIPTRAI